MQTCYTNRCFKYYNVVCEFDLTYIPLLGREKSLQDINAHLKSIVDNAAHRFKDMHIVPNYSAGKLLGTSIR